MSTKEIIKQRESTVIVTILFIYKIADVNVTIIKAKVKSATPKVLAVTRTAIKAHKVKNSP